MIVEVALKLNINKPMIDFDWILTGLFLFKSGQ